MKVLLAINPQSDSLAAQYGRMAYTLSYPRPNYLYQEKILSFPTEYDIGIGFLYPHKIPKEELNRATWINFHPGLEGQEGRNIAYRVIEGGESHTGGTVHYMTENFDEGPIIMTESFPIRDWMTAGDIVKKSYDILLNLFVDQYHIWSSPQVKTLSARPREKVNYACPKINDFIEFTPEQSRLVRALTCDPYYPKIKIGGKTYKVVRDESSLL